MAACTVDDGCDDRGLSLDRVLCLRREDGLEVTDSIEGSLVNTG